MKRDTIADFLKGYACLLVVFGHVIMGVRNCGAVKIPAAGLTLEAVIWSFHVPLFMFVSGYVYNITGEWYRKGSRLRFLGGKLMDLGIPYVFFSIIYIFINSAIASTNSDYNMSNLISMWYEPIAQYWFIYALFIDFVLYVVLNRVIKNKYILAAVCVLITILRRLININYGFMGEALSCVGYFALGACIKNLKIKCHGSTAICIIIAAAHIMLAWYIKATLPDTITLNAFMRVFLALLGFAGSICLMNLAGRSITMKRALLFITKYSFPIYLLHTIFTAGIRIALVKVGITNYGIHITAGTVIGVVIPVIIAVISSKIVYTDIVFYPSRTIKKLRNKQGNV
ncbi:MAG: acyltransferase family protein [Candidatus Ornithomonoglobus sp.]